MTLLAKTNYASASDLERDPVWAKHGIQAKDGSRGTLIDHPVFGRAARFEVRSGDSNVAGSGTGERCEVLTGDYNAREGDVRAVARMVDLTGYVSRSGGWNVVDQWHDEAGGTQSPIHFWLEQNRKLGLRLWGGPMNQDGTAGIYRKDLGPVDVPNQFEFAYEITFSADPTKGRARVMVDGNVVWDQTAATIYQGRAVYYKQGIYRAAWTETSVLVSGDTAIATSLAEARAAIGTPAPPTNAELRDQAVAHLKATTITYPEWVRRVENGYKGRPYDPAKTEWGRAFAALDRIG